MTSPDRMLDVRARQARAVLDAVRALAAQPEGQLLHTVRPLATALAALLDAVEEARQRH